MRLGCQNLAAFKEFFAKAGVPGVTAKEIVANSLMAEFVIENGDKKIGMCVISYTGAKPEVSYIYLEEKLHGKEIQKDIKKTLKETNK